MPYAVKNSIRRSLCADPHDWRDLDAELRNLTEGPNIPEFVPTYYIYLANRRARTYLTSDQREAVFRMHREMTAKRNIYCEHCFSRKSTRRYQAKKRYEAENA